MQRTPTPRDALEAQLFDLEQTVEAFSEVYDFTDSSGIRPRPAWLWVVERHVEALRAAHERMARSLADPEQLIATANELRRQDASLREAQAAARAKGGGVKRAPTSSRRDALVMTSIALDYVIALVKRYESAGEAAPALREALLGIKLDVDRAERAAGKKNERTPFLDYLDELNLGPAPKLPPRLPKPR